MNRLVLVVMSAAGSSYKLTLDDGGNLVGTVSGGRRTGKVHGTPNPK